MNNIAKNPEGMVSAIHAIIRSSVVVLLFALSACEINDPGTPGVLVPRTADEDPTIPSIQLNGAVLHSEAFGPKDSAIIVVLHGGPGSDYRGLLACRDFVNHGYRVVFYDQRGSGLSQRFPQSSYTIGQMYDELAGVIEHYRTSSTQKVFLLGHSWGAMLASAYINEHLTAIDGAVLAEPGGLVWKDVRDYIGRAQSFGMTSESFNDAMYMDQFITGDADDQAILDYKYALMAGSIDPADNPLGDEGQEPFWRRGAVINKAMYELGNKENPNWTTNLRLYTKKVLFAYSERSKAYGYDYAVKVSSVFPDVQLFRVNGGGHETMMSGTGWSNFFPAALSYFNSLK